MNKISLVKKDVSPPRLLPLFANSNDAINWDKSRWTFESPSSKKNIFLLFPRFGGEIINHDCYGILVPQRSFDGVYSLDKAKRSSNPGWARISAYVQIYCFMKNGEIREFIGWFKSWKVWFSRSQMYIHDKSGFTLL